MMSLWDALRMNMMISYQELVRTFPNSGGRSGRIRDLILQLSKSPVSYTHLDVFKRQILICAMMKTSGCGDAYQARQINRPGEGNVSDPVSYTHLIIFNLGGRKRLTGPS